MVDNISGLVTVWFDVGSVDVFPDKEDNCSPGDQGYRAQALKQGLLAKRYKEPDCVGEYLHAKTPDFKSVCLERLK